MFGSIDEVVQKWGKHHSGPPVLINSPEVWYKKPIEYGQSFTRRPPKRRRRLDGKDSDKKSNEGKDRKPFRLVPPVLQDYSHSYKSYCCHHCKIALKPNSGARKSRYVVLYDMVFNDRKSTDYAVSRLFPGWSFVKHDSDLARRWTKANLVDRLVSSKHDVNWTTSQVVSSLPDSLSPRLARFISWIVIRGLHSRFPWFLMQSEDIEVLQRAEKSNGLIFVSSCRSLLDHVLLALVLVSCFRHKVPFVLCSDSLTSSSVLRYFLSKIGLVFVRESAFGTDEFSEVLVSLVSERSVVAVSSPGFGCIEKMASTLQNQSRLIADPLIVPSAVSVERSTTSGSAPFSLLHLFKSLLWRKSFTSMVHVCFGAHYSAQSLRSAAVAFGNPPAFVVDHISYDILQSSVFLPSNIVAFMLLAKFRNGASMGSVAESFENMLSYIKECHGLVGFCGSVEGVLQHAFENLAQQGLVDVYKVEGSIYVSPCLRSVNSAEKLYKLAIIVYELFSSKAIIACSLVATLGGTLMLRTGNEGAGVTLSKVQIFENGKKLFSLLDGILNMKSPCLSVEGFLNEGIDFFTSIDLLIPVEDQYDDVRHRKLADHVVRTSAWNDDDENWGDSSGVEEDTSYKVCLTEENVTLLTFYQRVLQPHLSLLFFLTWTCRHSANEITVQCCKLALLDKFERLEFPFVETIVDDIIRVALANLARLGYLVLGEHSSYIVAPLKSDEDFTILLKSILDCVYIPS